MRPITEAMSEGQVLVSKALLRAAGCGKRLTVCAFEMNTTYACLWGNLVMELLLLGLMGLGAFSYFMDDDDPSTPATPPRDRLPPDDNDPPALPDDTPPPASAEGQLFELVSGVPNPAGTSGNDTFSGNAEGDVLGGGGNDLFDLDDGYGARVFGGAGNDTLGDGGDAFALHGDAGDDLIAFSTNDYEGGVAYGGAGNERFEIDVIDSDFTVGPTLSGGSGADVFDLDFQPGFAERGGAGKVVTITDFTPGEDSLAIDFPDLARAELVENRDGGYSDLNLHYQVDDGKGGTFDRYVTIQLQGITGKSLEDLGISLPDTEPDPGRLYEIASGGLSRVDGGEGADTIRGIADGSFLGGGGNDVFDIETGADSTLDGGLGNDVMTIGEGVNFTILGGAGKDVINADSTSNTQESSTIDGGDGDDRLNIDISLSDPIGQRVDTLSGGAGADRVTLDLEAVDYSTDYTSDRMLVIKDLEALEDDLVINIRPEDAPFYKGASLVPNPADGSTDLVLTFERTDSSGVLRSWAGVVKLLGAKDLVIGDDGPIQIRTAA